MQNKKEPIDINDLMTVMSSAFDARRDHDNAFEEHVAKGGYSWGWYGASLIQERDRSMKRFGDTLERYIDQRIAESKPTNCSPEIE